MPTLYQDWTDETRARELDARFVASLAAFDRFHADLRRHIEQREAELDAAFANIRRMREEDARE